MCYKLTLGSKAGWNSNKFISICTLREFLREALMRQLGVAEWCRIGGIIAGGWDEFIGDFIGIGRKQILLIPINHQHTSLE